MVSTTLGYEIHQTILAADEWVHEAFDMLAVVGAWALWLIAGAGVVFVAALITSLLVREIRPSSGGVRNPAASTLPRPSVSLRERHQRQEREAPLTPRRRLQPT